MPTYEYRCPEGHDFEEFVLKISDARAELPCPTCGSVAPRRVSAGAGLLFKGSGFYITDYGKDGKKDQREAAKAGTAKAGEAVATTATGKAESPPVGASSGASAVAANGPSGGDKSSAAKPAGPKPATSSSPSTPPKSGPAK
jgi:putative FmdB family regulatory protein